MDIDGIVKKALSRRTFLAGAGSAAAVAVVAGCSDNGTITLPSSSAVTDTDILNFALNLEYLEAEFYLRAATGSGLASANIGSSAGTVNGGTKVPGLSSAQQNIVNELAYTEQEHVIALRGALGSAAVSRPNIDLTNGFAGGVTAANNITGSALPQIPGTFSPFASFDAFLVGGFLFEDVGVTAYNGAAPLLSAAAATNGTLAVAAGIMAVEAYHGGMIRTFLTGNSITQGTTAYPYALYANRLSLLRAAVGGGNETQLMGFGAAPTVVASATASSIVPADGNALAYHRSTDQVLHIAYGTGGGANVSGGGFFPNGTNGNIHTTQS